MTEQLDKFRQKRDELNAKIQKLEAAEKTRERKKDVRRKILLGAFVLEALKRENSPIGQFKDWQAHLDGYLTRSADRALFELDGGIKAKSSAHAKEAAELE